MSIFGRRDYRDPAREKFGKPTISYPDESVLHPTLTERFSHRKDSTTGALAYLALSQNPAAQGCYLTKQASSRGDDDSSTVSVIYDRLPGVVKTTYPIDETYGITMKVQTQVIIAVENPPWVGPRYSAELVFTAQPSAADTVTIGSQTYTFVATLSGSAFEVLIGPTLAATLYNLASAINLDWGVGVNFGNGTTANANAIAWFSNNVLVVADINTPSAPVTISVSSATASWNAEPILVTTAAFVSTGNFSNGDTVSVGGKTYTMQTALTNRDGNVLIGFNATISLSNLGNAINLGSGSGTNYAADMTANPAATATGFGAEPTLFVASTQGLSSPVSTTSTHGAWQPINGTTKLYIEEKEIDVNRVYRISSRVIFPLPPAVSYAFGHDISLPDTLQSLSMVWDQSGATGASTQNRNSYGGARAEASASNYTDGGLLLEIINGFRGVAIAQYNRWFSLTPPLAGSLPAPTLIKPSLGTLLVRSVGESLEQSNGDLGCSASASSKIAFKTQHIGPVLTNGILLSGTQVQGVEINITNAGSLYATAPAVTFTGGTGSGAVAVATINLATGAVSGIIVTNAGNYTGAPSVTLTGGVGVSGASVTAAGTGYTNATASASISGGGGTGATATVTVDDGTGHVTGITITNPGTGYTSAPAIAISDSGTGAGATASTTINLATAIATLHTVDSGTGDYTPPGVTAFAASPDGNGLYPAAQVTANAYSHASLAMPDSKPQAFSKGDQIVAAVNVQQWRLGIFMVETVTVTVPG